MSVLNDSEIANKPTELRIASEKTSTLDRLTDWFSDWFSPILVKETRQALKSRQFFWTFFLLLLAIAVWTLVGLTINRPSAEFDSSGPSLLTGYWVILGFPLAIVIPFGTYRSLAREFEDGTIQLVSVTTMKARQIVAGKLGSSLLQMLVYVSILAPCIAFTYLLRGLSLPQITTGMVVCISGSFTLCCIALFFAGATKSRMFGVAFSIILIVIQIGVYALWGAFAGGMAFSELVFLTQSDGFFLIAGMVCALVSTGFLMFAAAASMISFDSDNRSTFVRFAMLIQQTLFVAWGVSFMCFTMFPEQSVVLTFITSHYWIIMGFLLVGESPNISTRVRRSIPQSIWGKSIVSFLLPGPGRGLLFVLSNIWFCAIAFFCLYFFGYSWLPEQAMESVGMGAPGRRFFGPSEQFQAIWGLVSICLYSSFFVSTIYLLAVSLRGRFKVNGRLTFSLGILLVITLTGGCLLFHFNFLMPSDAREYSVDQIFNWYWTTIEITDNGFAEVDVLVAMFAAAMMAAITLIAVISASKELLAEKSATPQRVTWDRKEEKKIETPSKGETIDEIFGEIKQKEIPDRFD